MLTKLAVIQKYFSLLESFSESKADFDEILDPSFQQVEFPNILNKNGQSSDLAEALRRAAAGKKILAQQNYQILKLIEDNENLAIEARWIGTMAIDAGPFKKGQELKANFCFVCEFKNGRILRQRNYDCFEPFE